MLSRVVSDPDLLTREIPSNFNKLSISVRDVFCKTNLGCFSPNMLLALKTQFMVWEYRIR